MILVIIMIIILIDIERAISLYQLTLYHLRNSNNSINENQIKNDEIIEENIEINEEKTTSISSIQSKPFLFVNGGYFTLSYFIHFIFIYFIIITFLIFNF